MDHNERNQVIAKSEDMALNNYLDSMEEREDRCCTPCCRREAHLELEGEMYCNYCYQDALDRKAIDALK